MQTTVTTSVKLRRRKRRPSGPANPHIPGLRRPQMRHTGASAFVSRPHVGHRMEPDVLRNIGLVHACFGKAVAFVEPDTEVNEPAGERAERPIPVFVPRRLRAACRARHAARRRHRMEWYWRPTKRVNSSTFALTPRIVSRTVASILVTDFPPSPGDPRS